MKKEIKDIIFVGIISLFLVAGLIVCGICVNTNAFEKGKSISFRLNYANRTYEYNHLKTQKDNLYEFLCEYNDRLALDFEPTIVEDEVLIASFKGSYANAIKASSYRVRINGEPAGEDISLITIEDGDEIIIDFMVSGEGLYVLARGGNTKVCYYTRVTISITIISIVILMPTIAFIALKLRSMRRLPYDLPPNSSASKNQQ